MKKLDITDSCQVWANKRGERITKIYNQVSYQLKIDYRNTDLWKILGDLYMFMSTEITTPKIDDICTDYTKKAAFCYSKAQKYAPFASLEIQLIKK